MGFDNECILNIQSLPGEYFCPVCRLLVYPNEALQSQCTHLYCKPCLMYVVSTTHACPYDGYLVTETDSKPLIESNKALAETIGKITVHCLYHRSGCTWQGPLSECTPHCSGCAFGNSAVVCNRCGIQIAHRQVQEHAQNCPGVQTQAQAHGEAAKDAAATRTTTADQAQAATQAQAVTQAQTSQTTTPSLSVQDPNQQGNPTTQPQPVVQATVPATEQWLQQQQPYQQYYQQYPGYDLYQQQYQQYYPYQQHAVLQYPQSQAYVQPQTSQPQLQSQLQAQPPSQLQTQRQAHPNIQLPAAAQTQSQPQVNPQQQTTTQPQSQTQPTPHGHLHPQAQMHQQIQPVQHQPQNAQMPQHPLPYTHIQHSQPQVQPQSHSLLHPQQPITQPQPHSQRLHQTPAQHPVQPLPQPHASQPNQPVNPRPHAQLPHSSAVTGYHSYPQLQPQQQVQLGGSQHAVHTYPQGGPQSQTQHPIQMQGQFPHSPQSHVPIQNPQQSGLLPSTGQAPNVLPAQQPVHPHPHLPGHPAYQRPVLQSVQQQVHQQQLQQPFSGQVPQQGTHVQQQMQMHTQLRPQGLTQSKQPSHAYPQPQQNVAVPHGTPPYQTQNLGGRPMMPPHGVLTQPHPHSSAGMHARAMQLGSGQEAGNALRNNHQNQMVSEQHSGAALRPMPERQGDQIIEKGEVKTIKSESDLKPLNNDNKSIGDVKDVSETFGVENGEKLIKQVKKEPIEGNNDISNTEHKLLEDKESDHLEVKSMKSHDRNVAPQHSGGFHLHGQVQGERLVHPSHVVPIADQGKQQRPLTPHGHSSLQQRPVGSSLIPAPPGPPHHMQLPGHPSAPLRPLGLGLGQPPNTPSEVSPNGVGDLGSTSVFGRGSIHHAPQGPFAQGERTPSYGHESDMFRANAMDGRRVASGLRLRDDKSRPLPPSSRIGDQGEFEEDLKQFPKPSHLGMEKYGGHFPSRPIDRGPHSYAMDLPPKPFDSGPNALNYDSVPPSGPDPPRFFPPYRNDGMMHPNDVGETTGFHDNAVGRPDSAQTRPDYFGPPRYGRQHMDGMAPRSPGIDYTSIGAFPGPDDIAGREPRRFGDSFHGNRFPVPPSLSRRGEFEGPGPDRFPKHFRRGEHLDPHDLPSHMREPIGYGASRVGDFTGPDNFFHPRHAEPGYRSSFSHKGIPGDVGHYAVDLESFDSSKRRKSSSTVRCRICKVDCETVEGLDLHSQKRDHQKNAMDMVLTIKQNALKQKLAPGDHLSLDDVSKSRNTGFEGRGNKN